MHRGDAILQGTTPALEIAIDTEDFSVDDVKTLEIGIYQGGLKKMFGLKDAKVDSLSNSFTVQFSEEDTFALAAGRKMQWQMRCVLRDGSVFGTLLSCPIAVEEMISKQVISE